MNTQQQQKFNILLIGDKCTDIYQYGTVDRISPEAPVPVFVPTHKEEKEGMAGNVYANLVSMGCRVDIVCGSSSRKTRLIDSRSKQQIVRIDEDIKSIPVVNVDSTGYDAVVISDYNKGVVSYELMEKVIQQSGHGTKFPVFIDTKKHDLDRLQGAWVKINEYEYSCIHSECTGLIVTKGSKGVEAKYYDISIPAVPVEIADVTGAGDTFLSAFAFGYLSSKNLEKSISFANAAASISVRHHGVYVLAPNDIEKLKHILI